MIPHGLKHRFGWYRGRVESAPDPADPTQFYVYFQCAECGLITGLTPIKYDEAERLGANEHVADHT